MKDFRVRFAPSPTGALHIGGVRTALYNYLLAKKMNGTFILRIEDTDQKRLVQGAEDYIVNALKWCGIMPTEGQGIGGDYGPYRQSERKELYQEHIQKLIDSGNAYYAFDTPEELDAMRKRLEEAGGSVRNYCISTRMDMKNSLTLPADEVAKRLASGDPYTIRLKVPADQIIVINDVIRGAVKFDSNTLDDKVMMKGDGLPTYHLANIVDDHSMKISHVIRGEEWLPSTAHHVLLYRAFGWEGSMPQFAHLPLILKPSGKGKLSKRDGKKLGIPVFPLSWNSETPEDNFTGFKEFGFDPKAVINFLAFLGWNPGTEQEIFSLDELAKAFSLEKVGVSGARFDFDKAKWYNQEYIKATDNAALVEQVKPWLPEEALQRGDDYLAAVCGLLKERVEVFPDFAEQSSYFFGRVQSYDEKNSRKRWKPENLPHFEELKDRLAVLPTFDAVTVEAEVATFMSKHELGNGQVFPILRLALAGTMKGPGVFEVMEVMGKEKVIQHFEAAFSYFEKLTKQS